MQRWMVVLERQDVLGALLGHGLGHLFLTPPRVDRHDGACQCSHPPPLGKGGDVMGLGIDFAVASPQPMGVGPRADHVHGALGSRLSKRAPQRFPIHRDDLPVERLAEGLGPTYKALGQFGGLEP